MFRNHTKTVPDARQPGRRLPAPVFGKNAQQNRRPRIRGSGDEIDADVLVGESR